MNHAAELIRETGHKKVECVIPSSTCFPSPAALEGTQHPHESMAACQEVSEATTKAQQPLLEAHFISHGNSTCLHVKEQIISGRKHGLQNMLCLPWQAPNLGSGKPVLLLEKDSRWENESGEGGKCRNIMTFTLGRRKQQAPHKAASAQ